jgi:hypothetical protein
VLFLNVQDKMRTERRGMTPMISCSIPEKKFAIHAIKLGVVRDSVFLIVEAAYSRRRKPTVSTASPQTSVRGYQ